MRHGYHRRAKALFELLVSTGQGDTSIYLSLGSVLVKCGHPDQAVTLLTRTVDDAQWTGQDIIRFRALVLSEALQALGHIDEARAQFQIYLESEEPLAVRVAS